MSQFDQVPTVSGHAFRREGKRGAVWYAKYRLPDGRQVQKRIGPPKSGKVRSVPLGGEVAATLARLAAASRWTGHDDLVFAGDLGGFLDGSALRRRAALTIPCRRW